MQRYYKKVVEIANFEFWCKQLLYNFTSEEFRVMSKKEFKTISYFIKYYFNWSMNWSELEYCIEEFLMREKKENIDALKREVETMYMLNDSELIREVAYDLGDRGMPTHRALDMIKVLYTKTRKSNK